MNLRRITAISLTGVLALAACGGDDSADSGSPTTTASDASADESSEAPTTTADDSTADGSTTDGPAPTIAPDVPEEFLDGVGPVAIVGDPLPAYDIEALVDPAVGLTAPVLVGETIDGEPIRVDATVDGPTWLIFLAHWCSHCNDEIPVINQLRDDGLIPDGVNVVGVSTAYNPGRPNWPPDEWLDEKDWTFTAINDGIDTVDGVYIAADGYGIGGFPFSILIDGDGIVTERWSGEREPEELVALVTDNLAPA